MHKIPVFSLIGFVSLLLIASILIFVASVGVGNFLYPGKLLNLAPIIMILLIIATILSVIAIAKKELPKALWIFNIVAVIGLVMFPIQLGNKNLYVVLNSYDLNTIYRFNASLQSLKHFSIDDFRKKSLLMSAVREHDIAQAKEVILDASDREKSEALVWAQSFEMIKILVDNGADVNYVNDQNLGILNSGCTTSHHSSYQATKFLIEHGINTELVNMQSRGSEETPLHCGDRCSFDKSNNCQDEYRNVELMLQYGANPNIKNLNGETPIFTVSDASKKILIDHGADVSVINNYGETLLFRVQDLDLFKLLVQKGIDLNHKNRLGKTALEMTRNEKIREYFHTN